MQQLKYILIVLIRLISHPDSFWQDLDVRTEQTEDKDQTVVNEMQQKYYFPMLGGAALILFLAKGFSGREFSFELAMRGGVSMLLTYFGGLYVASFLIDEFYERYAKVAFDRRRLQCFVAYTMSFALLMDTIIGCFPSLKFFLISEIIIFYIAWCGAIYYLRVTEDNRTVFTFISSLIIIFAPMIVGFLLHLLEVRNL
jgi:hypothetical protein